MAEIADRPLKLALVTVRYPPLAVASGIATYTRTLAHLLAARGHEVHVVTRWSGDDAVEREGAVTVHRLGPGGVRVPSRLNATSLTRMVATEAGKALRYRRKLARYLHALVERESIDLVEAVDAEAEAVLYRPRHHPSVPFVVRLHGPVSVWETVDRSVPEPVRRFVRWAERRQLLAATHVTAPSRAAADLCREELALSVPATVFPNPPSFDTRREAPSEEDPNLVLFVGRIVHGKGVDLLVRAIPIVLERFPKAQFAFVGSYSTSTARGQGSIRDHLLALLPQEQHANVHFDGYRPPVEVATWYRRAAACAFPSRFESFGYTCLEAMSFGKAIVGSRAGGMVDLLDDGRCGLLFTPPNVEELAERIATLLNDPSLRRRLGGAARDRAAACYSQDAVGDRFEAFYRQAIADRAPAPGASPAAG